MISLFVRNSAIECLLVFEIFPRLSHLEEMASDRGLNVDKTTIQRWVIGYTPKLEGSLKKKKPVGSSWRMDETYIKVDGKWTYLYAAVDKKGKTIDYYLPAT